MKRDHLFFFLYHFFLLVNLLFLYSFFLSFFSISLSWTIKNECKQCFFLFFFLSSFFNLPSFLMVNKAKHKQCNGNRQNIYEQGSFHDSFILNNSFSRSFSRDTIKKRRTCCLAIFHWNRFHFLTKEIQCRINSLCSNTRFFNENFVQCLGEIHYESTRRTLFDKTVLVLCCDEVVFSCLKYQNWSLV